MQTMSRLRDEVFVWESLDARLAELHELTELLETDPDSQLEGEIDESLARIEEDLEKQRIRLLLNGPHDAKSAIISIHAGNGGTDAMDWVQMLLLIPLEVHLETIWLLVFTLMETL